MTSGTATFTVKINTVTQSSPSLVMTAATVGGENANFVIDHANTKWLVTGQQTWVGVKIVTSNASTNIMRPWCSLLYTYFVPINP